MNLNDYKDGNGNVEVSETLVGDLIGGINTNETAIGVNTTAIAGVVESGYTENRGFWTRFDDGTQICTANLVSGIGSVASGALFISPPLTWIFPQPFVGDVPVISAFVRKMVIGGANPVSVSRAASTDTGLDSINNMFVWYTSANASCQSQISITAIGRWK